MVGTTGITVDEIRDTIHDNKQVSVRSCLGDPMLYLLYRKRSFAKICSLPVWLTTDLSMMGRAH